MIKYHQPVLLKESVDGLDIKPDGIYVDATFGGGGHSREILSRLDRGKLVAFDQDEDVLRNLPDDDRFIFVRHNFRFLKNFLKFHGIERIDGLLADLGVSSHHFDTENRGFSFRFQSTIDMRMNQKSDFTAKDLLNTYSEEDLIRILKEYGEFKNARSIAKSIVQYRGNEFIERTRNLIEAVERFIPRHGENQFLAKLYQAIRIEVNHEIDYLKEMLEQVIDFLNPGGRIVIISYHSIEDRVVKNFFRDATFKKTESIDLYGGKQQIIRQVNRKVIVPGEEELKVNNRARSAKLRIAEKI